MLETLNAVSPFLATMGGAGASVAILIMLYRFQKDVLNEYRTELREAHARRREVEDLHEVEREHHRDCVQEREQMRVAMQAHGVPWNPEDWIK